MPTYYPIDETAARRAKEMSSLGWEASRYEACIFRQTPE